MQVFVSSPAFYFSSDAASRRISFPMSIFDTIRLSSSILLCSLLHYQNWPGSGIFSRCTTCEFLLECQFHGLIIAPSYMEYDDLSYAVPSELSAAALSPHFATFKSACFINSTPPCQPYAYILLLCKEHAPGHPLLLWVCKLHPSQTSCWAVKRSLTSITLKSRCNIDTSLQHSITAIGLLMQDHDL